jgi:hypothetical protein
VLRFFKSTLPTGDFEMPARRFAILAQFADKERFYAGTYNSPIMAAGSDGGTDLTVARLSAHSACPKIATYPFKWMAEMMAKVRADEIRGGLFWGDEEYKNTLHPISIRVVPLPHAAKPTP